MAFGVILGLFVSNWNEKKNIEAKVEKTLTHIVAELETNVERLDTAYVYHSRICVSIDSVLSDLPEEEFLLPVYKSNFKHYEIPGWNGVGIPGTEKIAFESAKVNGFFEEIDIEQIQDISRAYKLLESYGQLSKAPLEKFLGLGSDSKVLDIVGILELICYDVKENEKYVSKKVRDLVTKIRG